MRTDLAVESKTNLNLPKGIHEEVERRDDVVITRIDITDNYAAKLLDKPIGRYVTVSANPETFMIRDKRSAIAALLSAELRQMVHSTRNVMVIGLGNRYVTADSLGTKTAEYVLVTRHIHLHMKHLLPDHTPVTTSFCTNVLGVTGLETAEVVSALSAKIEPDLIILVDSLAANSVEHIGCVIQCNDSGIAPGSGVGNFRTMLTKELLNVPVIAIGVPTVVSAETIVRSEHSSEKVNDRLKGLIVAPKDIDAIIRDLSRVLSDAVNLMLFGDNYPSLERLLR